MTRPEDAIERARRAAAEGGPAPEPGEGALAFEQELVADVPTDELLQRWAVIHVDPARLYSTRRFGAPFTLLKRALLRLLRQYTNELEAQQSRFNLGLLGRLRELERRRDD